MKSLAAYFFALVFFAVGLYVLWPIAGCKVQPSALVLGFGVGSLALSFTIAAPASAQNALASLKSFLPLPGGGGPPGVSRG